MHSSIKRSKYFFHYSAITIALFLFARKTLAPCPFAAFSKQATLQSNRVNGEGYVFYFWRTGY
jgi:hypothetical protein